MALVKLWNKRRERFFTSGKGRDTWSSVGKIKATMKTSYFPDVGCHKSDYEFVTYELVETSREEVC